MRRDIESIAIQSTPQPPSDTRLHRTHSEYTAPLALGLRMESNFHCIDVRADLLLFTDPGALLIESS